jgi:hypothetical protein
MFGFDIAAIAATPFMILIGLVGLFLYFIPAFIAFCRNHNNAFPILLLNLFLGWSFIAWIIALIWSMTNDVKKD